MKPLLIDRRILLSIILVFIGIVLVFAFVPADAASPLEQPPCSDPPCVPPQPPCSDPPCIRPPAEPPVEIQSAPENDDDGDGIENGADRCPTRGGPANQNGCPADDLDGDFVLGENDLCPDVAAPGTENGCYEEITGSNQASSEDPDGDGIFGSADLCPDIVGIPEFNGCQFLTDRDGDALDDTIDVCPGINANGSDTPERCSPTGDIDGDGVLNGLDLCPRFYGSAEFNGCSPNSSVVNVISNADTDSDGDGVADGTDACPRTAGSEENGCPANEALVCYIVRATVTHTFLTEPVTARYRITDADGAAVSEIAHVTFEPGDYTYVELYLESPYVWDGNLSLTAELPDGISQKSNVTYTSSPGACDAENTIDTSYLDPAINSDICYILTVKATATEINAATADLYLQDASGKPISEDVTFELSGSGTGSFSFYLPGTEVSDINSLSPNVSTNIGEFGSFDIDDIIIGTRDLSYCDAYAGVNQYLNPDEVETFCANMRITVTSDFAGAEVPAIITDSNTGEIMFDGVITINQTGTSTLHNYYPSLIGASPVVTFAPVPGVEIDDSAIEFVNAPAIGGDLCEDLYQEVPEPTPICSFAADDIDPPPDYGCDSNGRCTLFEVGGDYPEYQFVPELIVTSVVTNRVNPNSLVDSGIAAGSWVSITIQGEELCTVTTYEMGYGGTLNETESLGPCPEFVDTTTPGEYLCEATGLCYEVEQFSGFCATDNGDEIACNDTSLYYCFNEELYAEGESYISSMQVCDPPPPPPVCSESTAYPVDFSVVNVLDRSLDVYVLDSNCNKVLVDSIPSGSTWSASTYASYDWVIEDAGEEVEEIKLYGDTVITVSETEEPVVDASLSCTYRE